MLVAMVCVVFVVCGSRLAEENGAHVLGFDLSDTVALNLSRSESRLRPVTNPRRALACKLGMVGLALAVVAGVVVALVLVLAGSSNKSLKLPATFSASYSISAGTGSNLVGNVHKTQRADGTWQLSGTASVTTHNQTISVVFTPDTAAYFTVTTPDGNIVQQGCLGSSGVPPLENLQLAVESAVVADVQALNRPLPSSCDAAQSWVVLFSGLQYVVCQTPDRSAVLVQGPGVNGLMSTIDSTVSVVSPFHPMLNASDDMPMSCPAIMSAETGRRLKAGSVTTTTKTTNTYPPSGNLLGSPLRRLSLDIEAREPEEPRPRKLRVGASYHNYDYCIFVPGAGVIGDYGMQSSWSWYWGAADTWTACKFKRFMRMDTSTRAWDDPILASTFCTIASSTSLIQNSLIIAHGSGNLIVANALSSGLCSMDSSSDWTELQPFYHTGLLSSYADSFCRYYPFLLSTEKQAQSDLNLCTTNTATTNLGWKSVGYKYVSTKANLASLASYIKQKVTGAVCGTAELGLLGSLYWGVVDDTWSGSVPSGTPLWSTCWDPAFAGKFKSNYTSPFYAADINYLDTTCRYGDGATGSNRQPCQYLAYLSS